MKFSSADDDGQPDLGQDDKATTGGGLYSGLRRDEFMLTAGAGGLEDSTQAKAICSLALVHNSQMKESLDLYMNMYGVNCDSDQLSVSHH